MEVVAGCTHAAGDAAGLRRPTLIIAGQQATIGPGGTPRDQFTPRQSAAERPATGMPPPGGVFSLTLTEQMVNDFLNRLILTWQLRRQASTIWFS
jgi:hypothetical protein